MDAFPDKLVPNRESEKKHKKNLKNLRCQLECAELRLLITKYIVNNGDDGISLLDTEGTANGLADSNRFSDKALKLVLAEIAEKGWYAWTDYGNTVLYVSMKSPAGMEDSSSSSDESD